jgi:hypothetical protein
MTRLLILVSLGGIFGCGANSPADNEDPELRIHLQAADDGGLRRITVNEKDDLGSDEESFQKLDEAIEKLASGTDSMMKRGPTVRILADGQFQFRYVLRVAKLCAGRENEKSKTWQRRIEDIRLILPKSHQATSFVPEIPLYVPLAAPNEHDIALPDINVRLRANQHGSLVGVKLGHREMGVDEEVFERLNAEILKIIGRAGNPLTQDLAVLIDADEGLRYHYVIEGILACHGRLDSKSGRWVVFIENIGFDGTGPSNPIDDFEPIFQGEDSQIDTLGPAL